MIDIHSHILPGIDDGAKNMQETIAMAKQAVSEGITQIIATPHHRNNQFDNDKDGIVSLVKDANNILQREGIPLSIHAGQEVRIFGEMVDAIETELLTLNNNGKYMLVELPSDQVPRYTEKLLYDLQMEGIIPIIPHPERNREIIENPDLLYRLVKNGAVTQVTAASITGRFGKKIKKFALQCIDANLAHLVSSDAHNLETRGFHMKEAYEVIEKEFGKEVVYMMKENATYTLNGQTLIKEVPERIKKKKILGIF
ncbi:tyrosine protein phosphatase [Lottiidibacillus patelloidae]|uniref:Tyrosine-protein phosphatase n=1 Tax=Lottiidibacillus patelloidae TaxID=2670334 RepID=A0A263BRR3_9BACI|nr:CpsB/CapC family capsule biosynthesis tyrosine phosphatase [Lottiidibacillus patelloidae]OZM56399.1 tyrosine protein phosphatase [Lottiidibacillus patelloidae]